ncbi:MAG: carbon starvation protein A [Syntrophobacteraceae bacterium]|nr:carbon starvation protein A [Syntrophobacteraceae bacterium]
MNALTLVIVALCVFALGYRFYGIFIANRVLGIDPEKRTPAHVLEDGIDYCPTNKYVLFGHHFAAIAAAGPLLGPVLAAQFGYLPGALWIIIGAVVAGGVHDMVILFASMRHNGKSISLIAESEIGKSAGVVAGFAVIFILILTLAGLSLAEVNAMMNSPWSAYTVFCTLPIAVIMGIWMRMVRPGDVAGASMVGVALLALVIVTGPFIAAHPVFSHWFTLSKNQCALFIAVYGFAASALPVWLLLLPRDYLSTYLKLGTITALALGIVVVHPYLQMGAFTKFIHGGGPLVAAPGSVFPFLFITIACGALSGFHAIIGAGTTPKMIDNEKDIIFVGYGAMLTEGFVAIMALIAACVLVPSDYFAINASAAVYKTLGMSPVHLPQLAKMVQEHVQGRPGGAVSLAVGMAYIFSSIPFMKALMAYWYHFAIMFEAVFILTAVDAGTRVGRYMLQEMIGKVIPKFSEERWIPGIVITSALFTCTWGYLVYTGNITIIWPLFGMSNQLLAACALIVGTTMIMAMGKMKYSWITAVPGILMLPVTMSAGYYLIKLNLAQANYLLVLFAASLMALMAIVFVLAFRKWILLFRQAKTMGNLALTAR